MHSGWSQPDYSCLINPPPPPNIFSWVEYTTTWNQNISDREQLQKLCRKSWQSLIHYIRMVKETLISYIIEYVWVAVV